MLNVFMTSNQCLSHFDDVQSTAQLPYLTMLALSQSLRCRIILGLIKNELAGMWKELAVAYPAFVVARNELCIKLIRGKLKRQRRDSQVTVCILQGEIK
jgi:hypothetical protein